MRIHILNKKKRGIASGGAIPRFFNFIVLLVLLSAFVPTVSATQIIIDINGGGQTTSIQAGIDMAATGDTVLVMPGTYFENINYNGKTIVLASQYLFTNNPIDINLTIIDGNMQDGVVKIISGEEDGTSLVGFTIRNGLNLVDFVRAGGVSIINSVVSIENCAILNNYGKYSGAISCDNSLLNLISSNIKYNRALGYSAAGNLTIAGGSEFFISGCSINNNFSDRLVGGVVLGDDVSGEFDPDCLNSIYLNYGARSSDMHIMQGANISNSLFFDTITSQYPESYHFFLNNGYSYPVPGVLDIHFNHVALESSNGPLYVNPEAGDNQNSGLSVDDPLKNIYYALLKLHTDENNPGIIYMANGTYGNFINGESFPLQARDYTSLIGESADGVIWDGQDTTVMLYSHPVSKTFGMKNVYIQHAGKSTESRIIVELENDVQIENLTITESNTLHPLIVSQIGFYDTSYYKDIHIFNNRGGQAFQEMSANFNEETGTTYYENISIVHHRPILENEWTGAGGGLVVFGEEGFQNRKVEIKNILLSENQYLDNIWSGVSAMSLSMGDYTITNATIADNLSDGSRAVSLGNGSFKLYNSIFFGNETGNLQIYNADVEIHNSLVYGGSSSITYDDNSNLLYDNSTNLNENPYFSEHEDFFYYLLEESPCINSGTSEIPGMELPETDIIGNPRVYDGQVDMGAYEYVGPVGNQDFPYPMEIEKPALMHLFPNPLIDYTKIEVNSNKRGKTRVYITNLNGYLIAELCNTSATTLKSTILFENNKYQLAAGTYLLTLEVDGEVLESQQMVVVK